MAKGLLSLIRRSRRLNAVYTWRMCLAVVGASVRVSARREERIELSMRLLQQLSPRQSSFCSLGQNSESGPLVSLHAQRGPSILPLVTHKCIASQHSSTATVNYGSEGFRHIISVARSVIVKCSSIISLDNKFTSQLMLKT